MADANRTGVKITTLRESLGLSAAELAERADCDVVIIEQIEAGEIAASLAPLIKITRALGCRLGTLLDDDEQTGPVVNRAGDGASSARMHSLETGVGAGTLDFFALAADKASRHMEPFLISVNPADMRELSSHEGEEFIYVLDGTIEVEYGTDIIALGAGDSIYLDSIVPHQVRGGSPSPARILAVVYAPF
jgi:transcriptional regulator with XRE-family HTH domain